VTVVALRDGPGRYEVSVDVLAERVKLPREGRDEAVRALLAAYARQLENQCLRQPYQWFNFFDYWQDDASDADPAADGSVATASRRAT
jgi:predicted LPLAT superfamily acyltransferase